MNRSPRPSSRYAPFAPQSLGQQQRGVLVCVQGRGVELHELHVAQHGPGPVGHGVPVAGGHVGVGGVREDLPGAAAGQHDRPGAVHRQLALLGPARARPRSAAVVGEQVDDELASRAGRRGCPRPWPPPVRSPPRCRWRHRRRAPPAAPSAPPRRPGSAGRRAGRTSCPDAPAPAPGPGPPRTRMRTASSSHRPPPATRVSCRCSSGESRGPRAAAMPPWARKVVVSSRVLLVSRATFHLRAAPTAAVRPAMPPPTTRTS